MITSTVERTLATNEVFLDTAYAIALSVTSDEHHERAVALAEQLELRQTRLITTRAVLLEIGNALSRQRYRPAAIELLAALEHDPQVERVSLTDELYRQALELFHSRPDKEWGLIDLTTDEHFEQAGFRALLREN